MKPFIAPLAALTMLTLAVRTGEACSCVVTPHSCGGAITAAAVFEATVESTELAAYVPPPDQTKLASGTLSASEVLFLGAARSVTLRDVKTWRGESGTTVLTAASGDACGYDFRPGVRYLIVATRLEDGRLVVSRCSLTRPISEADGFLEYIGALNRPDAQSRIWGQVTTPAARIESGRGLEPMPGARVWASGPVQRSTATDSAGRYVLRDLPPGAYSVNAEAPASLVLRLQSDMSSDTVTLEDRNTPACAEVNFRATYTGSISGEVTDETGRPMTRALVELRAAGDARTNGLSVETDLAGRYQLSGISPGEYVVGVGVREPSLLYPFAESYARRTDGTMVFELRAGERITVPVIQTRRMTPVQVSGTVRERDGMPVPGVVVAATMLGEPGRPYAPSQVKTDSEGRFQLRLWEGRPYRIIVGARFNPEAEIEFVAGERFLTITKR
jgi:hypothetical protein